MTCKYTYNGITYNSKEEFIEKALRPNFINKGKTRRILEVQSDLFQKGRDKEDLIGASNPNYRNPTPNNFAIGAWDYSNVDDVYTKNDDEFYGIPIVISEEEFKKAQNEFLKTGSKENIENPKNQFLQLLNKDNNWVTFFVKSIIQDSSKRGYEKVLFPLGNTASKVEGHEVLEDYIAYRENRLIEIDKKLSEITDKWALFDLDPGMHLGVFDTQEDAKKKIKELGGNILDYKITPADKWGNEIDPIALQNERDQFERELGEAQDGTMKFSTIANFYETIITNILKKQGYKPNRITDEYGNKWNEVSLSNPKALELIDFNKQKPADNTTFKKQILSYLQDKDIIAKKEFPAGSGNFYIKKTILGQDRNTYMPEEVERRNIDKIIDINQRLGFEAISTQQIGNGLVVKINSQLALFDSFSEDDLELEDVSKGDIDFLNNNLYTDNTLDLIDNVYRMALMFNKSDIVNIGNIIKQNENILEGVKIEILNNEDLDDEYLAYIKEEGLGAGYNAADNKITLYKDELEKYPVEKILRIVMEEFVHALTVHPFHKKNFGIQLTKKESEFVNSIDSLYKYYNDNAPLYLKKHYRFSNQREFIIGLTLDSNFRDHLEDVDNKDKPGFFNKIITDLVNAILKFFGIKTKKDIQPFDKLTINYINQYISDLDKISPLNLKDSPLISNNRNIKTEKDELRESLSEEQKEKIKDRISKFILQIKSVIGRTEDIKNPMYQMRKDYDRYHEDDIDMIDYFFNFTREMNRIYDSLINQINSVNNNKLYDNSVKIDRLIRIMATVRQFDATLTELEKIKVDVFTDKDIAKDLGDLTTKRSNIQRMYSALIFPMVVDVYSKIAQPAIDKELKFLDDEIDRLKTRIVARRDAKQDRTADQLEKKLEVKVKEREKKSSEASEVVENYLRGLMGDSDTFTMWVEATIVNPNIIPSGLTKYIKDTLHKSDETILRRANQAQTELDTYEKESGVSRNNLEAFNRPILDTYDVVESVDEDGVFKTKKKLSLLTPYNLDYILELQKFSYINNGLNDKIKKTKDVDKIKEYKEAKKKNTQDRLKFLRDYMEMPYLPEVHAAMDLIHEDLGGYTAYEAIGELYEDKNNIEEDIERTSDEFQKDELYALLDDIEFKIKEIRSTYDKEPGSKEYKIAAQLRKRDEALREFRKFVLTPSGEAKFKLEKDRIDKEFESGEKSEKDRNYWYQHNTVTALSDEYWKKKLDIIEQMNSLLNEMNASAEKSEDVGLIYKEIENIVKPYRDENGIIQGNRFNDKQVADVKALEEKLEELKNSLANIFGLTKTERIELAQLNDELQTNDYESQSAYDPARVEFLKNEKIRIEERMDQINSKKKKFNKKLLTKYFDLMKKLSALDTTTETHYYTERYDEELNKFASTQTIVGLKDRFVNEGVVYEKVNNIWYARTKNKSLKMLKSEVEKVFKLQKAQANFEESEWFKNNHIQRMQWVKSEDDYDPMNIYGMSGSWEEVNNPIYIWRQTTPTDPEHKIKEQPSLKYKRAVIKDGREPGEKNYRNPLYKTSVNGYNLPKLVGAKDDKYINKEYQRMLDSTDRVDKARLRYLNFFTQNYLQDQIDSYAPKNSRPGYDMPSIRKSTQERIQATSVGEAVSQVGQYLRGVKDELVKNEQDKDILYGYLDNKGMIAIKFQGEIDLEDQTIDIFRSLGMYHVASQQRMRLGETWALSLASLDILKDPDNTPVKMKNGKVVSAVKKYLQRNTEVAKHIEGQSNTLKQVNEMYNYYYLGEKMKDEKGSKALNKTLGLGANLMLGLNFTSMIQNWSNAKIQSILELETSTSKNFSIKDWVKAESNYWANIGPLMNDLGKFGNKSYINQFVDYFGGINFTISNTFNNTPAYKTLTKTLAKMLMPTEIAEHQLSYVLFMSIAMNTKVEQEINGETKTISLFDAFRMGDGGIELKEGVKLTGDQKDEFINKINASARRINGEYGNMDLVMAQKLQMGRLFLFMNKYFIPFFRRRFAKRRFNIQEGMQDDGFYRTFFKTIGSDIKNFNFNIVKNWKDYSPSQKAGIYQTGTEISISFTLMAMIAMLGGDDDKELKDNGILANNIIYVLKGIKRQNESMMLVPGLGLDDVVNRIKNPFPITTKIVQSAQVLNDMVYLAGYSMGYNELKDVQYTQKSGWHNKGDWKIWNDVGRLISGPNKLQQILHPDIAIKNANAYRIK